MQFRTEKRNNIVNLPDVRTNIYQSNTITNASYSYTLIQERIFNYVMFFLQAYIRRVMNGENVRQLDIFNQERTLPLLDIPLNAIGTPSQYRDIRESARELAAIVVTLKGTTKEGGKSTRYMGMFSEVIVPDDNKRSKYLTIEIKKDVALMLVSVETRNNVPINYTSFILQVANDAKNKYTSRIYKKICSWKSKGGFIMTVDEFREWLQLGDKYTNVTDIMKRIIVPVQQELTNNADCWFNVGTDFFIKSGKKVTGFRFKVITPDLQAQNEKKYNNAIYLLKSHFNLKDEHIKALQPIFDNAPDYTAIGMKILDLADRTRERKKDISSIPQYVVKALLNEFSI